jgi:hypothetical protein
MKAVTRFLFVLTMVVTCLVIVERDAYAYIGPGAGMTAIGTVVAFIGAVLFAIVGFVWYPIKRLIRMVKSKSADQREPKGV